MAETPYLVDSNVLLRWVKPNHRDYPVIVSATDAILRHDGVLCYTSQNVGEFWNLALLTQPKTFAAWLRPLFRKDWVVYAKRRPRMRLKLQKPRLASHHSSRIVGFRSANPKDAASGNTPRR